MVDTNTQKTELITVDKVITDTPVEEVIENIPVETGIEKTTSGSRESLFTTMVQDLGVGVKELFSALKSDKKPKTNQKFKDNQISPETEEEEKIIIDERGIHEE